MVDVGVDESLEGVELVQHGDEFFTCDDAVQRHQPNGSEDAAQIQVEAVVPGRELEFCRFRAGRRRIVRRIHLRCRNGVGVESTSDGQSECRRRLLQAGRIVQAGGGSDENRSGRDDGRSDGGSHFDVSLVEKESAGCPVGQLRVLGAGGTGQDEGSGTGQDEGSGTGLVVPQDLEESADGRAVRPGSVQQELT